MTTQPPFSEDDVLGSVDYTAKDAQKYEDTVVAHLCSRYGLGPGVRQRLRQRGDGVLRLRMFHDEFPTFPMILAAHRWRKVHLGCRVVDLFSNFPTRKFVEEWRRACLAHGGGIDGHFGLVFHWPYLRGQLLPSEDGGRAKREPGGGVGLVLRKGAPNRHVPGVRVVCISPGNSSEQFVLEPLSVLLNEIDFDCGGMWCPNV